MDVNSIVSGRNYDILASIIAQLLTSWLFHDLSCIFSFRNEANLVLGVSHVAFVYYKDFGPAEIHTGLKCALYWDRKVIKGCQFCWSSECSVPSKIVIQILWSLNGCFWLTHITLPI